VPDDVTSERSRHRLASFAPVKTQSRKMPTETHFGKVDHGCNAFTADVGYIGKSRSGLAGRTTKVSSIGAFTISR